MCSEMEKKLFFCLCFKVDVNSFSQSVGIEMDAHKSNISRIMLLTALTAYRPQNITFAYHENNHLQRQNKGIRLVPVAGWRETNENKMRNYGQRKGKRCHRDFGTLS